MPGMYVSVYPNFCQTFYLKLYNSVCVCVCCNLNLNHLASFFFYFNSFFISKLTIVQFSYILMVMYVCMYIYIYIKKKYCEMNS